MKEYDIPMFTAHRSIGKSSENFGFSILLLAINIGIYHAELSVCAELGKVVSFTLSPRTAEIWWRCYAHTAPAIDYSHLSCGVKFNYLS